MFEKHDLLKMSSVRSFAFCQCFLTRNIFLHKHGLHVTYESNEQFIADYENVIPQKDFHLAVENVRQEIQRRKQLREDVLHRKDLIRQNYQPLHPDVYKFDPAKVKNVANNEIETIGKDIFSLPVFQASFISKLMEELDHFKKSGIPHEQPNSMNRHGILLDEIGFQSFFDSLRIDFIQPWARKLFQDPELELDSHKAFVVKYALDEDIDLAAHFDNAEITLNVALSNNDCYEGGELIFNTAGNSISRIGYEHKFGHGVLHHGSLIHQAMPITSGERWNLIIWTRSSTIRQEKCPMCKSKPNLNPSPPGTYGDGFLLDSQAPLSSSCTLG